MQQSGDSNLRRDRNKPTPPKTATQSMVFQKTTLSGEPFYKQKSQKRLLWLRLGNLFNPHRNL
jgi:hypothetical protein